MGLVSKQRGQPSHHQLDVRVVGAVLEKLKGKYAGFGPTLAHEKLVEQEGVKISLGSVRKVMLEEGLWKPRKAGKVEVHPMRERRSSYGELEQMDGADHEWFEERGERCSLLVMIDDATGKLGAMLFVEEESFYRVLWADAAVCEQPMGGQKGCTRINMAYFGSIYRI